ncbi:MAG: M60 family metallopeptidase [Verrucomicrobiae bacterium]|nr:M60 family metallopeptidase [Verrucomicrobiae bacterium]
MLRPLLPRFLPFVAFFWLIWIGHADDATYRLITGEGGELNLGKAVPGVMSLTSEDAFALLRDSNQKIVAAASQANGGRAVAFSHGGFLKSGDLPSQPAAATLVRNSIRWAGRSSQPKVGVGPELTELKAALDEAGFETRIIDPEDVENGSVDVYCVLAQKNLSEGASVRLLEFQKAGGGIVAAATPWAFAKQYAEFRDFPGNVILFAAGIRYEPDGYANTKTPLFVGRPGEPDASPAKSETAMKPIGSPVATESSEALDAARRLAETKGSLPAGELGELIGALKTGIDLRGDALDAFLVALKQLNEAVGPIVPTKEAPVVPGKDPLVDAIISLENEFNQTLPAGVMYPIPAAADYPGAVPEDAERVTRELSLDGTWKGWLSGRNAGGWAAKEMRPTGLYAAPGEIITVTSPGKIVGRGFEVVIGAYGGGLENRDQWNRYPRLQRKVAIDERTTRISNALGGLITIRVPKDAREGDLDFTIEGGVEAPLYVYGKTDLSDWKNEVRKRPAPWAELASERIIIAIPSDYIRRLNDPDKVMEVWNGFIDTAAELVQVDRNDYRAERIVFDRQTSAGSMHSSYPVAAHLGENAEQAVDARSLKEDGNWGFFHEYGHNHQHDLWSLPGTGETTCNLWSVYLFENYIGKNRDNTHNAIRPLDRKQRMNAYFKNGRKFESEWAMWVALEPYLQVQEKFGWEPFKKVFDEYNHLPQDEWPKTQQEKNDQWVIRLSRACETDLAPFWSEWNLPLSKSVFSELKELPAWEDDPVKHFVE